MGRVKSRVIARIAVLYISDGVAKRALLTGQEYKM